MKHENLKIKTRWEHDEVPAGKSTQRGLLIEVTGREMECDTRLDRPPLNLAIVIDRSGSMANGRLTAARKAAIGISRRLKKTDRLSIVAYDDTIQTLQKGVPQDAQGREAAKAAISRLHTGGCTDLGGGWMMGAKCVAEVMDHEDWTSGHVLMLSDGHSNRGLTDPTELAGHASAMADRGVTSSCVGIGHGYSPLQLDAIAEAGRGQLHHSDNADEIVDVVLGDLGDMTNIAARTATLRLRLPGNAKPQQLTRFREHQGDHYIELELGDIIAGRTRRAAFMIAIDKRIEPCEQWAFQAGLSWRDNEGEIHCAEQGFHLTAVDPAKFNPQAKHKKVARTIAELWLARMGYEAMILNERGLFREAVDTFVSNDVELESLISDLEEKDRQAIMSRKQQTQSSVGEEWSGSSKLMAFTLAKKFMRSEADYTGRNPEDWSDRSHD